MHKYERQEETTTRTYIRTYVHAHVRVHATLEFVIVQHGFLSFEVLTLRTKEQEPEKTTYSAHYETIIISYTRQSSGPLPSARYHCVLLCSKLRRGKKKNCKRTKDLSTKLTK